MATKHDKKNKSLEDTIKKLKNIKNIFNALKRKDRYIIVPFLDSTLPKGNYKSMLTVE